MVDFVINIGGREVFGDCIQTIGTASCSPSLLIGLYAFWTEIISYHIGDSGQPPLRYILTSTTTDIEDMQEGIITTFKIENSLKLLTDAFGLCLDKDSFDPVVERFEFEGRMCLTLMFGIG